MITEHVDVEQAGERWTLVFVRELPHPPAKVWRALTDPAHVGAWAPYRASRDLGHTGAATLTMVDGATTHDIPVTVRLAQEPSVLEHTWDVDVLRWELTPTAAGTRLTLRHTMDDRGMAAQNAAGWHMCLDVAARLLDGEAVEAIRGGAALEHGWEDLRDGYALKLS